MPLTALQLLVSDASPALCEVLASTQGGLEAPIRSEIFGPVRFAQHGRSLGLTHRAIGPSSSGETFSPKLRGNIVRLRAAYEFIEVQARAGYDISPAAEWLIENFHLLEDQFQQVSDGLPRRYFFSLPVLLEPPLTGLPRIYGVAWAFVAHTDGAFDEDLLIHFLSAYRESCELNLSELWALPTTLRVVLVENMRRLAERVAGNKAARELANLCSDRIESYTQDDLTSLLALLNARGAGQVFLAQMLQRLQDSHITSSVVYLDWLRSVVPDFSATQTQLRADQAADNLSVSNAVKSLRALGDADWSSIVAHTSALMQLLLTSPVFAAEHSITRDESLHAIERLAKRSGHSETAIARTMLDLMAACPQGDPAVTVPSYWLAGAGSAAMAQALGVRPRILQGWRAHSQSRMFALYLGSVGLLSLGWVLWMLSQHSAWGNAHGVPWWLVWPGAVLLAFPVTEAVIALTNRLVSESVRPMHLHRLVLLEGIPAEHRVMVVIPCMLTDQATTDQLVHRLHLHALANPESHAQFALLSDWADANDLHCDTDAALLVHARQQIATLNSEVPPTEFPRFILLHRERSYSETEQQWIGWERKRGKLELLINNLAEGGSSGFLRLGEESRIAPHTRYVVTLDSDTQLPPGRLRSLVGVAAHPYNLPQWDAQGLRVVSGYGILQPRIVTPLAKARDVTLFHWLFSGQTGVDTYSAASSEVYQDLFGEGSFTGKGLLHVAAMHRVLCGRLPQGYVLSHDLLEGALARSAVVSDITVVEDAPFHADVAQSRVHRWTRGDWQLLPFLLRPSRWGIGRVHYWKMLDNLRRSLVAPMSLALIVASLCGWVVSPAVALMVVFAAYVAGPLMGAFAGLFPSRNHIGLRHFYQMAVVDVGRALWGGAWFMAQLVQHALRGADAIVRALYRMAVSHRHLMQWTTAATAHAHAQVQLGALVVQHGPTVAFALLLGLTLAVFTSHPVLSVCLALVWAASPLWTWLVSRPRQRDGSTALEADEQHYLTSVARDTWRFFERTVTVQDLHLPPDNLQVLPYDMLAHRTSPTNIGLYLLSTACARQFGWIGTQDLLSRLDATLQTLSTLQRYEGHFYNWYDTQTGVPLLPMYVSTVDSGNLSGHLLCVAQACLEWADAPSAPHAMQEAMDASAQTLRTAWNKRHTLSPKERQALRWQLADHKALRESARLEKDAPDFEITAQRLRTMAQRLEQLAWEPRFGFLYHPKRHLFHIGLRVAEQQLDTSFYDLLASEARLTSLLAIAKGDVPVTHWAALGRMFYALGPTAGLRSWSGSMFEYLMPSMVLEEPEGSVLRDAGEVALREQIAFAQALHVPWGISECAYAGRDASLAYQYAPQGIPRLALRRTPADELVIAPYATALAAQVSATAACANLHSLQALGTRQRYGFIEALDYSPARQTELGASTAVATFMAHHQGMTIAALANVLLGGVVKRWGSANPRLEAISSLMHERAPREVSGLYTLPTALPPQMLRKRLPGMLRKLSPGVLAVEPTYLLSNGNYNVSLRANGAGQSRWGQTGISRWRDDALRDAYGHFMYLGRPDAQEPESIDQPSPGVLPLVSLSQHPAPDSAAQYRSIFHSDRVCLGAQWPDLHSQITVWVSPEDDIEFRQVELRNLSAEAMDIELVSTFEVSLSDARADESHPAFTNMFVRALWRPEHQALVFERTPRLSTERGLHAAHFLARADVPILRLRLCTDRQKWCGRNGASHRPHLEDAVWIDGADSRAVAQSAITGLDPMCAMGVSLRLAAHSKARLTFATSACDNADTLHAIIDKYRQASHIHRSSLMSATLSGIRLRSLHISAENFAAIQSLTTALLFQLTRPKAFAAEVGVTALVCDRRLLWRFGISGDRPLIVVTVGMNQGLGLLRSMCQALRLWAWSQLACDLVVINTEPSSYLMTVQCELNCLQEKIGKEGVVGVGGTALHVVQGADLSMDELSTLHSLARIHIQADGRPLIHHLQEWMEAHADAALARKRSPLLAVGVDAPLWSAPIASSGHFVAQGSEYRFEVSGAKRPVRPWANVMANPGFGTLLTEAGGGYTWAINSRLNQLTAWSNDPVADSPAEWLLLQDCRTLEVWSASPNAWGDASATYTVTQGQGYCRYAHTRGVLDVTVCQWVDQASAAKRTQVQLVNRGTRTLGLRVLTMVEWMMGSHRGDRATTSTAIHSQRVGDARAVALLCTQHSAEAGFGGGTAYVAWASAANNTQRGDDWTCDRREFFDAQGHLVLPQRLGQSCAKGLDPCAALACYVDLPAGQTSEVTFVLGFAPNASEARLQAMQNAFKSPQTSLVETQDAWSHLLQATRVATPDPLFDALVNYWLLYQTVSCRLWAKAGFYQAGGATGFRDQLQDAMALVWAAPEMLHAQIVLCASRQFVQGDVQHWWHAPTGVGVRTHFSDDLLWLPHASIHYVDATGDASLWELQVPYLEGHAISEGAEDSYFTPTISPESSSVYEHAARALDHSLRVGVHGLPLMGSGDWNDGMNRVGHLGRGESVWLAWFLVRITDYFVPLARQRGDDARATQWEDAATGWRVALLEAGWDGQWFKRAFFDDGQALGSHANEECRIDLVAQVWAVLSGAAPQERQISAMDAVDTLLVDAAAGLIKLLTPPLQRSQPHAGYIQSYPPGVRENGGQYAHAGVWAVMAQAQLYRDGAAQGMPATHRADLAYAYFTYLSPAHRSLHADAGVAYGLEPYAMAGDVYTEAPYVGRGGWSWYTGAAGLLHRAAVEAIFGLRQTASHVSLQPCLPSHWNHASMTLRREGSQLQLEITRSRDSANALVALGAMHLKVGEAVPWPRFPTQVRYVLALGQPLE
jgi:cyclic beta-1,2-glucan synthetase